MINTTTHANPGVSAYTRSHAAFRSFTARLKPVLLTINACATRCIRILALGIQQVVQILGMLLARFPRTTGLLVLGFILLALLHNVPYIGGILTYIAIVLVVAGGIVSLYTDTIDYFASSEISVGKNTCFSRSGKAQCTCWRGKDADWAWGVAAGQFGIQ